MLDREMGQITGEMSRLARKSGMSVGELEASCRMWFEQFGQNWYEKGLSVLQERARAINPKMIAEVAKAEAI